MVDWLARGASRLEDCAKRREWSEWLTCKTNTSNSLTKEVDVRVDLRYDAVRDVEVEVERLQGNVDPQRTVLVSALELPGLYFAPLVFGPG